MPPPPRGGSPISPPPPPPARSIVAGEWLGPYVVCKALAALVNATACAGLTVAVVSEPGGGAPTLYSGEQGTGEGGFPRLLLVPLTLGVGKVRRAARLEAAAFGH